MLRHCAQLLTNFGFVTLDILSINRRLDAMRHQAFMRVRAFFCIRAETGQTGGPRTQALKCTDKSRQCSRPRRARVPLGPSFASIFRAITKIGSHGSLTDPARMGGVLMARALDLVWASPAARFGGMWRSSSLRPPWPELRCPIARSLEIIR